MGPDGRPYTPPQETGQNLQFACAMLGGTFDRLHAGHALLLTTAFARAQKVVIGVTTDAYIKGSNKNLKEKIIPYEERVKRLKEFLKEHEFEDRAKIEPLDAEYSPEALNARIDAVVVSPETAKNLITLQAERINRGVPELNVIIVDYLRDANGEVISSTKLRQQNDH